MRRAWSDIAVVAALLVAACGGTDDAASSDGETGNTAARASTEGSEVKPLPGQYRTQVQLLSAELPGAPAGAEAMMRQAMDGRTHEYCLTPQEADQSFAEMAKRSQDGSCTTDSYQADGNRFQAAVTCQSQAGTMRMTMEGTGSPTSSEITMAMNGDFGGMGPASLRMKMTNQRIGDCAG